MSITCRVLFSLSVLLSASIASTQTTRPTTQPASDTQDSGARTKSSDQMLGDMLKPPANSGRSLNPLPERPATDKSGAASVKPNAPSVGVLREGTFIIDRVGRLTKTADGNQYEFTFESDGKALRDPPLIILPNLKLMLMENAVTGTNRDLKFRITGVVTEYRGRNYILLEKVSVPNETLTQF